ncbi:7TM diverse intracellular signaling domain-containing protein [Sphingobacterium oryzagri]|uniref:7TM diverse intracellular signaling domain-containing protein n=1 Tax=Sphingobacterium oryzagri TaxID=3025669 RepID=A0ABY7WCX2_9SPHI|nr:7TM diverse intracellular signaling domain-containing protein [Sphingobacterium sp. KACC 22765]WDF67501.1 7TM diverse intracellular signaling domain-containing protein [Sphingobacterium sp. KACC 22765]
MRFLYYFASCFSLFFLLPYGNLLAQTDTLPDFSQLNFKTIDNVHGLSAATNSNGDTWVRGIIPASLRGRSIILQIPSARLHDYALYLSRNNNLIQIHRNENGQEDNFPSRFPRFHIETSDSVYYLQFQDHAPQIAQVQLVDRQEFTSFESIRLFRIGLYYGLALMSVVFNFVFYLIFKDRRFITYCLLLLTTFISFFYEDGMFYYFSNGKWTLDYLMVWNNSVTALIALPFTKYFLDVHQFFRRYAKWFNYGAATLLAAALLFTLTDHIIFYISVYALCFLLTSICIGLAIRQFKRDVYARFLVLAFGLVVITAILFVLHTHIDSETYGWFDLGTFRLVSALEIISISFAIVYKVRALQDENEKNRQELDKYLRSIEQITIQEDHPTYSAAEVLLQETSDAQKKTVGERLKDRYDLTEREMDVLLCIWEGLTNKEIADRLFITVSTTKYHIGNLYVKLDVKNRNQVQTLRDV